MALAQTAKLLASIDLDIKPFEAGTRRVGQTLGTIESRVSRVGSIAGRGIRTLGSNLKSIITSPLGLLGLAGGVYGVERALQGTITAASDFHQQMELVTTQAGAAQGEVDALSSKVLDMAKATGTGPEALAMGLFHVESAGFRGAKALDILRIAAEGAKVGNADLETVTNALVGAEQSGIKGAESYSLAMGTLNAIVGAGNMRMEDLVSSFGSGVLASARTFGISLKSVGAALATMTDEGIPAVDAATRLRMSFSLMGAPTSKAIGLLKDIGISQFDLAKKMRSPDGFVAAIGLLRDHMMKAGLIDKDGNPNPQGAALLSRAFGGGRSSAAIMTLLSNFSLLQQKQDAVNKGATGFDAAWAKTQQTSAFHFAQFGAVLDKLKIKIGDKLLPVVTDALGGLSDWLDSHGDDIATMFEGAAKFAGQLGGAIKDDVLPIFGAIATAWGKLPAGLQQLLVGGFVLNKLTGGAVTGIAGALLGGGGGGLASKIPVVGRAFVQHVWVDNMGIGGFGAVTTLLEGAGAAVATLTGGGLIASLIAALPLLLGPAVLAGSLAAVQRFVIEPGLQSQAGQNINEVQSVIASGDRQQIVAALDGLKAGIDGLDPLQKVLYELNADGVKVHTEGLEQALIDALAKTPINKPGSPDDRDERHHDAVKIAGTLDTVAQRLHQRIEDTGSQTKPAKTDRYGVPIPTILRQNAERQAKLEAQRKLLASLDSRTEDVKTHTDILKTATVTGLSNTAGKVGDLQRTTSSGTDRIVAAINAIKLDNSVSVFVDKGDAGSRYTSNGTASTRRPSGPGHSM